MSTSRNGVYTSHTFVITYYVRRVLAIEHIRNVMRRRKSPTF